MRAHLNTVADVLVLGGGPCGATAAMALARAGRAVIVLERSRYDVPRIGEMLPPAARTWLHELGVWQQFERESHLASPGVRCVWGETLPYHNDFLFSPYGHGWHLDRLRFDKMLADAAVGAGAQLVLGTRARHAWRDAEGVWHVETEDAERRQFHGRFLVEALGRNPSPARPVGHVRRRVDRLVAVFCLFLDPGGALLSDHHTCIEAVEDGWWYAAGLSQGRVVVAFMTDADLARDVKASSDAGFRGLLEKTTLVREWLGARAPEASPRAVSASSYLAAPIGGGGRIAAGDSAFAIDPLSSQGITKAVVTGRLAAQVVLQASRGDRTAFDRYASGITAEFARLLQVRNHMYQREQRWPTAPFWRRRRSSHDAFVHQVATLGR